MFSKVFFKFCFRWQAVTFPLTRPHQNNGLGACKTVAYPNGNSVCMGMGVAQISRETLAWMRAIRQRRLGSSLGLVSCCVGAAVDVNLTC